MKFTDGFWQLRPGVTALYAQEAYDIEETDAAPDGPGLVVTAPTTVIAKRGDVLNRPVLTVTLSSPLEGVVRVRIAHHTGGSRHSGFALPGARTGVGVTEITDAAGTLTTGALTARIAKGAPWDLSFEANGKRLTGSAGRAAGYMKLSPGAARVGRSVRARPAPGVGELVHGRGGRCGRVAKNGPSVEMRTADGGTPSEQAYKNVPFYVTSRGYGVLVNDPGHVSFEVGSE